MAEKHPGNRWRALRVGLFCFVAFFVAPAGGATQGEQALNAGSAALSTSELDALIQALEDPASRDRLIAQLEALREAQQRTTAEPAVEKAPVQGAVAELLKALSERAVALGEGAFRLVQVVNQLPQTANWVQRQVVDPETRKLWWVLLTNLALIMGVGYGVFLVTRLLLARPLHTLSARAPRSFIARVPSLLVILLLELLAIALFAATTYVVLGMLEPLDVARVVALAWIAAATIVRLVLAAARLAFAPRAPGLRLLPVSDETAHYAEIWGRRLTFIPIYGYVALETAVILGLPRSLYETLIDVLGLIVSALVVVLIVQNREPVATLIRGPEHVEGEGPVRALRNRLAGIWHLIAGAYVILLYAVWMLAVPGGFRFILQATLLTLLVLLVGRLALHLVSVLFQRGLRLSAELRRRFPGLEARVNRYFPVLHAGLRWLVYAASGLAILEAWGLETASSLMSEPAKIVGSTLGSILLLVLFAIVIWEITSSLIDRYLTEANHGGRRRAPSPRIKTLLAVARNAAFTVITVVSLLLILSKLGLNIAPLLAGAGVVGLAVGFGAQTLVKDIITGAIILFQDLIAVGEVVQVGDTAGLVEAVSIRHVRLRDLSGTVHTIPFSAITTISNLTKDFSYYVFDVGIAYREDVDQVMAILKEIGAELRQDPEFGPLVLEPLEVLGLDRFADSAVIIKARIKTLPIQQWTVGREFNRRMKRRFDELGIAIPFPHRTLYFGVGKQGAAAQRKAARFANPKE